MIIAVFCRLVEAPHIKGWGGTNIYIYGRQGKKGVLPFSPPITQSTPIAYHNSRYD